MIHDEGGVFSVLWFVYRLTYWTYYVWYYKGPLRGIFLFVNFLFFLGKRDLGILVHRKWALA